MSAKADNNWADDNDAKSSVKEDKEGILDNNSDSALPGVKITVDKETEFLQ